MVRTYMVRIVMSMVTANYFRKAEIIGVARGCRGCRCTPCISPF